MSNDSPWGIVSHYDNERLIDTLHMGGVQWLRIGADDNGSRQMDFALRRGMSAYLGIGPDPSMTLAQWDTHITTTLNRFRGRMTHVHIGNEPNDASFFPQPKHPQDGFPYTKFLVQAVQTVHAHYPGVKVCGPELAVGAHPPPGLSPIDRALYSRIFLRDCISALQQKHDMVDVVSLHGYTGTHRQPDDLLDALTPYGDELRALGVTAPVWLTETGITSTTTTSGDGGKLRALCAKIGEAHWLKKVFFYVWSEDEHPEDPTYAQGKYKWLDRDLKPLPGLWDAYQQVTHAHRDRLTPDLDCELTAPDIPAKILANVKRRVTITATNTGARPWAPGEVTLAFFDRSDEVDAPASVPLPQPSPGQPPRYAFSFDLTPTNLAIAGELDCRWQLQRNGLPFGLRARARFEVTDPHAPPGGGHGDHGPA